ncbi:hypothetical protein D7V77_17450 [Corallococcus sp. CA041A]|uniref:sulfotransferase n=1 Tax=Corallococcus sp. CA041A TaxID=2316727 RepID=UPI000EA314FC|nr:sulfotransferase [Corallococcus sp. CA041A]RKH25485.1 hypothetical protein D7V77_17450 [Corallococcus sp. CA041A]
MSAQIQHPLPMPSRAVMARLWKGWLPAAVRLEADVPRVLWLQAGEHYEEAPFYRHAVEALMRREPRITRNRTSLGTVNLVGDVLDALKPSGFIFHMSRCGSTLVQNALRCLDGSIVPGEPEPLCTLLTPYSPSVWPGEREDWEARRDALLRSMVRIFGQRRRPGDRRYFVKFTSRNSVQIDVIRRLWPDVPWLFVYRNPVDVMVSNLSRPPGWMRMPADWKTLHFGWSGEQLADMTPEEYCARVVGSFCSAAARSADGRAFLLNYEDIDLPRIRAVMEAFGVRPTRAEQARAEESLRVYSKDPSGQRAFTGDTALKRRVAGPAVERAAERWALPAFSALDRHPRRLR